MKIKIGTRGSKLALCQTETVRRMLKEKHPEHEYEIVTIKTRGDRIQNLPLQKIGDKGLFVKEIENQLLARSIDFAVHSMKDMPSGLPPGLIFSQCPKREDPRDILISKHGGGLSALQYGARVGTGSSRRAAQLKKLRPDLIPVGIRGNLETRLEKLRTEAYDAIILAAAGLKRLGMEQAITEYFTVETMVPACAQGALALELRQDSEWLLSLLNELSDAETNRCISGERAFLNTIGGSCHIPAGAHCTRADGHYILYAMFGQENLESCSFITLQGSDPVRLGKEAAENLKKRFQ